MTETEITIDPIPAKPAEDAADTPSGAPAPLSDDGAATVVNHLLWHKALIDEQDGADRLDEYIALVRTSEKGEHLTIRDPFDKSIAIAFELVLQEHLNPWKIDLGEFSRLYLKRAAEEHLELSAAGRIILMAWTVLRLQSDAMLELAEALAARPPDEPEQLDWSDISDFGLDDEEFEYTQRVKYGETPIDEKIRRRGAQRKVTLMELVDAFEEVRREAEERQVVMAERARIRALLAREHDDAVRGMMHSEDPEEEQRRLWHAILTRNGLPIALKELHEPHIDSFVSAFNGVLFLAADRKIDLWQEDFPWGPILLRNRSAHPDAPVGSDNAASAPAGT